jgi:hypothetical protein
MIDPKDIGEPSDSPVDEVPDTEDYQEERAEWE